ncbi:hypothetical protein RND81_07G198800 [Saponaria officinalis]|uniref:Alpha-galactosidase n=1 Tax=Saponaria officinalis TaxID=3572 RepID=A0AAW1JSZ3_SAPOF
MKITISGTVSVTLLLLLLLHRAVSKGLHPTQPVQLATPPRGWNSYDSFTWIITEEEFLQNAELVSQRLLSHGYEYVVVDYRWYRRKIPGPYPEPLEVDVVDEWGRVIPDPDRWPSSKGGKGFREVAEKVHRMGLKFGIHIMRGISTQAVDSDTPILDTTKGGAYEEGGKKWTASEVGIRERTCVWMSPGFMSVNTTLGAGRAFLQSIHQQYADWGVDLVKHDCVFGDNLDTEEISIVSEILRKLSRPMLYSVSPGGSVITPAIAEEVSEVVNMYRIGMDGWDTWEDLAAHFDVSRDYAAANMIGVSGLLGKSWPDLDMLPLGWLAVPGSNQGPCRKCDLNIEEQITMMTLWAMAKSPLMFGGDMRNLDDITYRLITNPTILEINAFSSNNKETGKLNVNGTLVDSDSYSRLRKTVQTVEVANSVPEGIRSWVATGRRGEIYLAFFNLNQAKTVISTQLSSLAVELPGVNLGDSYKCVEVWSGEDCQIIDSSVLLDVEPHGAALLVFTSNILQL